MYPEIFYKYNANTNIQVFEDFSMAGLPSS